MFTENTPQLVLVRRTQKLGIVCLTTFTSLKDSMSRKRQMYKMVAVICLGTSLLTCSMSLLSRRQSKYVHRRVDEVKAQLEQEIQQPPASTTTKPAKPCRDGFKETFEREKRYICCGMRGGVGNFMFAYASVYGMATKVNKSVVIQKNNLLLKYFRLKAKVVNDLCVCQTAKFVHEGQHCKFNKNLLNLTEKINYRPHRYFQSWMYFRHVAQDIRQQFTFKDEVREKAISIIKGCREVFVKQQRGSGHDYVTTIGVHVRRGDIAKFKKFVDYGYAVAPPQYFSKAMAYYRKKYNTTLFMVCSDDIAWCKENINGSDVMFMEDNPFEVDFNILTHCNHSIMSVGTFGWWASFLAGGDTIYYKHPARDGSRFRNIFSRDYSDFFYHGWIGME